MIEDAGISDEDVERAWRLTRSAYDDPEHEGLEIDDTRAIIDSTGSSLHVAFRGTATPLNAAHDVAFLLRPLSDFPALRVGEDAWAARVHSGFAKMASNVADRLAERLENWPRRTVVLSGHSLGGALAILVGGALKGRGRSVQICTFGATPPGDAQCRKVGERQQQEGDVVRGVERRCRAAEGHVYMTSRDVDDRARVVYFQPFVLRVVVRGARQPPGALHVFIGDAGIFDHDAT